MSLITKKKEEETMESSANNAGASRLSNWLNQYSINNSNAYQLPDKSKSDVAKFPVRMLGGDPDDSKWAMRKSIVGENGIVPGVGMAIAGPDYDSYVNRKRIELQDAEFKTWVTANVDLSSPEKQEYYYNLFPFIRDERLAEVDRQAFLQATEARINITGPQSEEDWFFIYAKQQGYIEVSTQPLQSLNDQTNLGKSYEGGLFSIVSNKLFPDKTKFKTINFGSPFKTYTGQVTTTDNSPAGVYNVAGITGGIPGKSPT